MKVFDDEGIELPEISQLAKTGLIFEKAFSNAPVCSVARSNLISGCYAPRLLGQFHRTNQKVHLPEGLKMFPEYLRDAGYYTSNCSKEDYNYYKTDCWDDSSHSASYKNRKKGQPFFHVQNFFQTHESQLHFTREQYENEKTEYDADLVTIDPYHPDTALFRYTKAKYYDLHRVVAKKIGEFIEDLKEQGLYENTIIFYFGDHGGVLPGSKGYIYERGVHVPLIVHIPKRWSHLRPKTDIGEPIVSGTRLDCFVSFVDFAATVLNLAELPIPEVMDGRAFLGKDVNMRELNQRKTVFSHADRFDEKLDFVRAIRRENYKYIRNYRPQSHDALYNEYRYRMLAYQEWKELYLEGELNGDKSQFFEPKPVEALYDLSVDPFELNNLAKDLRYREELFRMRRLLQDQLTSMPDLSFFPEHYLIKYAAKDPTAFAEQNKSKILRYLSIIDLQLHPFGSVQKVLQNKLESKDSLDRYWALMACLAFLEEAKPIKPIIEKVMVEDEEPLNRSVAAEFLALAFNDVRPTVLENALYNVKIITEGNWVLDCAQILKERVDGFEINIDLEKLNPEWAGNPDNLLKGSNLQRRLVSIME